MRKDFERDLLNKWFCYNYECWWCGKNHWDCFHHIVKGDENSILNSAPLNNENCHLPIHKRLRSKENIKKLLRKTLEYLLSHGYRLKKEDKDFISRYRKYYIGIITDKRKECTTRTKSSSLVK